MKTISLEELLRGAKSGPTDVLKELDEKINHLNERLYELNNIRTRLLDCPEAVNIVNTMLKMNV